MSISSSAVLTKYVVGAKANPPKKPRSPPKKGNVIPMNIVNAETTIGYANHFIRWHNKQMKFESEN